MLCIKDVNVIDVRTGDIRTESVYADQGKTVSLAGPVPPDCQILDGKGLFLTPGFINCHTHLAWDGTKTDIKIQSLEDSDAISAFKYADNMRKCLNSGQTAVRDLGMNLSNIWAKQAVDRGIIESPRLYISGEAIMATGGHTWWCGLEADGPWELRKAVRKQAKAGAKVIKIMACGDKPEFTMEELEALVDESHARGLKVAAHATFGAAIERVVAAGVDSVEHGGDMTPELIATMKEKHIPIIPTLSATFIQAREGEAKGLNPAQIEKRKKAIANPALWAGLRDAARAGVPVCFGTDGGSPLVTHDRIIPELLAMQEIGMAEDELFLLRCLTINGAELIGDPLLGEVAEGKYADYVLMTKNPLDDIRNVGEIKYVVLNGRIVRSY